MKQTSTLISCYFLLRLWLDQDQGPIDQNSKKERFPGLINIYYQQATALFENYSKNLF